MALAYRAGAPLKDMEFVQYHPTGLPFTGILITEAARAEGGYLINKDGYRYLQDYNLGKPEPKPVLRSMELGPRDRLSQAFVKELEKGRTIDTPYGPVVHLDLRHLGEKVIDTKIPFVRELCLKYQNIDPVTELIPVRPVVHYMMGGVHTDINGATPLAGLYAAGEVACVSINGANRLGSNSLPELLVFGARAGRAAAEYASQPRRRPSPRVLAQAKDEQRRLRAASCCTRPAGGERLADAPRRDAEDDGGERRHLPHGRLAARARSATLRELQERVARRRASTITAGPSTPSASPRWSCRSCSTSPRRSSTRRCAARSRAARTSAPTSRRATTSASWRIRWSTATPTARAASSICR